jgi:upstream-binding transcription factor
MENRARDQEVDVKESSDKVSEDSEPTSSNEDKTSGACSDHDGQNILGQD